METFCGSPLWDWNLTWNTNSPDLTPCFERTILVWIPSGFLCVFSAFQIYFVLKLNQGTIPVSILGLMQQGLTLILLVLEIFKFVADYVKGDSIFQVYPADRAETVIKAATYALALFLQIFTKRKGVRSSGVLFLFWLISTICLLPQFQSAIRSLPLDLGNSHRKIRTILDLISYPIVALEFFLNFFADKAPIPDLFRSIKLMRKPLIKGRPCPEKSASVPNQFTFQWMYPFLWKGYKKSLEFSDLWDLNKENTTLVLGQKFNKNWLWGLERVKKLNTKTKGVSTDECFNCKDEGNNKAGSKNPREKIASVLPTLWKNNWSGFIISGILKLLQDLLTFVSPLILSLLIAHLGKIHEETWKGYFYMGILFITISIQTLCSSNCTHLLFLTGMRMKAALVQAIYRKSLIMSSRARRESTTGEIVNLMSVDTQRFQDVMQLVHQVWSCPLQIALALYLLWGYLGPAAIAGVVILVILIPINGKMATLIRTLRIKQMKKKDERVRFTNEVLSGIKVLKLYAWEPSFEDQIGKIRDEELSILRSLAYVSSVLGNFIWTMAPVLVSVAAFATYVLMDGSNVLNAEKAFVSLTLFNIMRVPMGLLPNSIAMLAETNVSLKRINKFMNGEEINPDAVSHKQQQNGNAVSVNEGNFTWDEITISPTLRNINLNVKKGSLVAIVGTVGSGKSSLLSAIVGEMEKLSGKVNTYGSIAYVAQQAWIQNATVRDNILFGKKFDPVFYDRIIEACALKPDLKILPGFDKTEIGEKGINLSGGQKQRVALARAVYNGGDIYLLDDPLSAVDSHVGKKLFNKVIGPQGILQTKARVLVTHGITYLPQVDHIVVMKNGEITESGNYNQLLQRKGAFAEFLAQHAYSSDLESTGDDLEQSGGHSIKSADFNRRASLVSTRSSTSSSSDDGKTGSLKDLKGATQTSTLVNAENMGIGTVKMGVYLYFIKAMTLLFSVTAFVSFNVGHGINIYSNFWLAKWSTLPTINGTQDVNKRDMYLTGYGILGALQALAVTLASLMLVNGCLKAAQGLHQRMLSRTLRSPMSFFDVTPIGRIINRFAKDVDIPDSVFFHMFYVWFSGLYRVLGTLIVISINTPIILTVIVPVAIIYMGVQRFYIATSRQLKRLESVSRSPIFSHFSETLAGLPTIRAFKVQNQFLQRLESNLDKNLMAYFSFICTNRWISFLLECVGNFVVLFATLFALLNNSDPGTLGLSISYALNITLNLNYLVMQTLELETNMVAVERIKEYCEIPQEAPWYVPNEKPSEDWPQEGTVVFNGYETKYREGLNPVLRGVTCNIRPGEKVGIVGRTGAGKSSFTLGLFRIMEATRGSILIDGIDISKIGLQDLRGRLTIIPQDPVLFIGTLRLNLDPSAIYRDDVIWDALEHAHLKDFVSTLAEGLNASIMENGENFSVGQRQLVCLARALLRKTKILILDEATAAVDLETDDLIQRTIRSEFKECTVLTIAHRLNTIMDSDRVMVLDKGEIQEFDHPQHLLKDCHSIFYGMAEDARLLP